MSSNEAEKKFWKSPELVEGLLHFLDPSSILELGQAHSLTIGLMQATNNWARFIRRFCPHPPANHYLPLEESTEQKVGELKPITGILQLMNSPQSHLLALLHIISERFPSIIDGQCIEVTCPIHNHNMSPLGFVLLELVESTCGPTELKVGSVQLPFIEGPLIPALISRVTHQEQVIRVSNAVFCCRTQDDAEALLHLTRFTEGFGLQSLKITGPIGQQGWGALAQAVRLMEEEGMPKMTGFLALSVGAKRIMQEARRKDIRAVWEGIPEGNALWLNFFSTSEEPVRIFWKESEEDWLRLELYLDEVNL